MPGTVTKAVTARSSKFHIDSVIESTTAEVGHLDESSTGHTITSNGTVSLSTVQKKFGDKSILFGGSTTGADYISMADHAHWDIGTNFTMDYWIYITALPSAWAHVISRDASLGNWAHYYGSAGNIKCGLTGTNSLGSADGVMTTGSWIHIAVVKTGSTTVIYKDGVSVVSSTTAWYGGGTTNPLTIGSNGANQASVNGYMDEIRISNVARWASGFTPPTAAYASDANTLYLHHGGTSESGKITRIHGTSLAWK
jgi:hypothetical protein